MHTEEVLSVTGTGLWHWDDAAGTVSLDATAARLLGLGDTAGRHRSSKVRARLHAEDFVSLRSDMSLARTEGTVAETLLRVVGEDGVVLRTIRARICPSGDAPLRGTGTLHEARGTARQPGPSSDWQRAREAFLLDAGRALAEADSTAEVLRVAAALSMPGFSPDGLAVFGTEGDRLSVIGHHGHAVGSEGPFVDMRLATDYPAAAVVRTGRAVYLPSRQSYAERFPATWPLAEPFGRHSWAFLPLVVSGATIGAWMAAFREPVEFTPDERSVLTTVARMLAQALSRAQQHETERELADNLQRTMLPTREPAIDDMAVAARYVPTGGGLQVGGDWYDVIGLPSGRTALVIGDVQGHDVRAAGLMGQLRIALRAYAAEGHHPDAVLSRTSRFLAGLGNSGPPEDERFATCLYLEVDPASGTLDVVRAGHPEPSSRLADGTVLLRHTAGGPPLGVAPDTDYPTTRLTMQPGETLLLCTDGLIETGGHDLHTGWKRLRDVLETGPGHDLEALADTLVQAVHGPASHHTTGPLADRREDDIALILLRRALDGPTCAVPLRRTVLTVSQTDPLQIRDARQEVRALLHDWPEPAQVEEAQLLVSELVTNVLVHTDDDALLTARLIGMPGARRLRIDVSDGSDDMPHRRHPGEMASSGRGLVLIAKLADAWGVDPRGKGKSTWFEIYEKAAAA